MNSAEVLAVPRADLLSAFGVCELNMRTPSTSWAIERLPVALRRTPFLVPGTKKLTLPISMGGFLLGIAGMALSTTEHSVDGPFRRGGPAAITDYDSMLCREAQPSVSQAKLHQYIASEKTLSPRELAVAQYLAEGYTTINISAILGLRLSTVRTYVRRIYSKLSVCSRVELALRFSRHPDPTYGGHAPHIEDQG